MAEEKQQSGSERAKLDPFRVVAIVLVVGLLVGMHYMTLLAFDSQMDTRQHQTEEVMTAITAHGREMRNRQRQIVADLSALRQAQGGTAAVEAPAEPDLEGSDAEGGDDATND